jgi:glycosyltransferase involved in cell wall biosynthesis
MIKVAIDAQKPEHNLYHYMRSGVSQKFTWVKEYADITILALENEQSEKRIEDYLYSERNFFLYFESTFWLTKYCNPEFVQNLPKYNGFKGVVSHAKKTLGEMQELLPSISVYHLPVGVPCRNAKPLFNRLQNTERVPTMLFWGSHNDLKQTNWASRGGPVVDELFCKLRNKLPCKLIARCPTTLKCQSLYPDDVEVYNDYLSADVLEQIHERADIFLLPSSKAHFISVPFAMSFAIPCAGLKHWALDEILDKQTGIIAADFEELEDSLTQILSNKDSLLTISLAALLAQRSNYNCNAYAERWEKIISSKH